MYTTGTAEETPNGQRRLRLASATNAAVPAYVELGLPLHTYHLPHWRRSGSLARAPIHRTQILSKSLVFLHFSKKFEKEGETVRWKIYGLNSRPRWKERYVKVIREEEGGKVGGGGELE